jgi:dynein heavy chain, axonemal
MHKLAQDASERYLHQAGRYNHVTPTSYLELLSSFCTLLSTKRAAHTAVHQRYSIGLDKLASTAAQVASMQAELVAMQPQLVTTVAEVGQLMTQIAHEKQVGIELDEMRHHAIFMPLPCKHA